MTSLTKVIGLGAGTAVAAMIAVAAFSSASNAATMRLGICQSATVNGVVDCCQRWVRTPDGRKWLFNGGACKKQEVVCKGGSTITHVSNPCYLNKILAQKESKHHQPPNARGNKQAAGRH